MSRPGVVAAFHYAGLGGPLRSHERELRWLASAYRLEVLVPAGGQRAELFEELDATVVAGPFDAVGLPSSPLVAARELAAARREQRWFRERLRQSRPSLAFAASSALPAFLLAARREGIPSVVSVAELWLGADRGRLREAGGVALLGLEAGMADQVIACSSAVAGQFAGNPGVTTIHPGIDERDAAGDGPAFRGTHGIPAGAPLIACVGNITRGRGQDVLLRALPSLRARHPGLRCVLQGDPFLREPDRRFAADLDRLSRDLGLDGSVIRLPAGPVGDLYAAADAVVNPSTTHPESFGRVPLEAGLAGTPSVITRTGVTAELHTDGATALLVDPGEVPPLAEAVGRLLADPELAGSIAAGAGELARRIADPERSLAQFRAVIERSIAAG